MQRVSSVQQLRQSVAAWRAAGERIALVPTMGNLHDGHMALFRQAYKHAKRLIVSSFVNPMQFGPSEDYERYPRTPDADSEILRQSGCDVLFSPEVSEVYPRGLAFATRVQVPGFSEILDGEFRPGHFEGVASVVMRLFSMVQPDVAIFGEKDYQQLLVIRRMAADLFLPVEIVGAPTVRAPDGLALSSRNIYLSEDERAIAPKLYEELRRVAVAIDTDDESAKDLQALETEARRTLRAAGFKVEYFTIRSANTLLTPSLSESELVVLVAARLGRARLIDNTRATRP
ncbi:MAG: pantoate--beta-alanine ligase [Steroidobacteraceae bacterium]